MNKTLEIDSENYFKAVFEAICEATIVVNPSGEILLANPQAKELFQYEDEEVIGQPMEILMPEHYRKGHKKWRELFSHDPHPRPMKGMALQAQQRDGTVFPVEVSLSPVKLNGEMCTVAIITDIINRQQLQERLREAELLETKLAHEQEYLELKSRFISLLTHEFRTPLTVINTSAGLLDRYSDQLAPEKKTQHLQRIQSQIKKLSLLLDDVLTVSKSGTIQADVHLSPTQVVNFCYEICIQLSLNEDKRFNFYADDFDDVLLDQNIVEHVLINLLTNAQKYTPNEGTIQLDVLNEGGEIIFRVSDTGIGIPSDDQKRLFEPFHRGSNVSKIKGTGLGLIIVKNSVMLHSGSLEFMSELGKGTTFVVKLPYSEVS